MSDLERRRGKIAIIPFAFDWQHNYSLLGWLEVERQLIAQGYQLVILHENVNMLQRFQSEKIEAVDTEQVTSILNSVDIVLGVNTGLMHFANRLGKRCVVLLPPKSAKRVFFRPVKEVNCAYHRLWCYWRKKMPVWCRMFYGG